MSHRITIIENFISEDDANSIIDFIELNSTQLKESFYGLFFSNNDIIKKYSLISINSHKNINEYYDEIYTYSASGAKWTKGSFGELHTDTNNAPWVEWSTIIYLNDDFSGGTLNFPHQRFMYKPKKYSAILFPSSGTEYNHSISKVIGGNRYTVLYMHTSIKENADPNFL